MYRTAAGTLNRYQLLPFTITILVLRYTFLEITILFLWIMCKAAAMCFCFAFCLFLSLSDCDKFLHVFHGFHIDIAHDFCISCLPNLEKIYIFRKNAI